VGRDPSRPPSPDHRDDPGALLYETQKVATVSDAPISPGNLHRLVNTLSTASATLDSQVPQQDTDCNAECRIRNIISRDNVEGVVHCREAGRLLEPQSSQKHQGI
jgi:hypothetical protein